MEGARQHLGWVPKSDGNEGHLEANDSQPKSNAAGAPAAADDADKKEADSAAVESSPAAVETKQDSTPQIGMIIALVVAAFCLVLGAVVVWRVQTNQPEPELAKPTLTGVQSIHVLPI